MSINLDERYLIEIQSSLKNFKEIHKHLFQCSCAICGDSKKDKTKARGYFYCNPEEDFLRYKCHNCGCSMYFRTFLKLTFPSVYKRYILESMKLEGKEFQQVKKESFDLNLLKSTKTIKPKHTDRKLEGLIRLDKLPKNHHCLSYVESRKIPKLMYPYLYYVEDFNSYINKLIPNKIRSKTKEDRLVIPYFDKEGVMYALQGRSLNPYSSLRYITVKFNESMPKIYGIDRLDTNKQILCVEGPIDSMFLPNALAVSGSSYGSEFLTELKKKITIVPDNEPYNKEVAKSIEDAIKKGFKVCLWRRNLDFKDINDAILKGYTQEDLLRIIEEDTISGFSGEIRFKMWKSGKI